MFIHLFESETDAEAAGGERAETAALSAGAEASGSDDDEFRPGELFALHRTRHVAPAPAPDTGGELLILRYGYYWFQIHKSGGRRRWL